MPSVTAENADETALRERGPISPPPPIVIHQERTTKAAKKVYLLAWAIFALGLLMIGAQEYGAAGFTITASVGTWCISKLIGWWSHG